MPEYKFTKGTDEEHEIELDSTLISASWSTGLAIGGRTAAFEVRTCFVGNGAPIKIRGRSESGKKLGKIKSEIRNNVFRGEFPIPEDIELDDEVYFEVKLSKNGLSGESSRIPATPPIRVTNMKWSAQEARRGDTLTLTADVEGLKSGAEVTLVIYEHDADGSHDRITEIPATVKDSKIELRWEYEYHEDTDEIPTDEELRPYGGSYRHPEYFFTVKAYDQEFGRQQESGLLTFKDSIEIELMDGDGNPIANEDYIVHLPDGQARRGTLGEDGLAREEDVPPGKYRIEFPNLS